MLFLSHATPDSSVHNTADSWMSDNAHAIAVVIFCVAIAVIGIIGFRVAKRNQKIYSGLFSSAFLAFLILVWQSMFIAIQSSHNFVMLFGLRHTGNGALFLTETYLIFVAVFVMSYFTQKLTVKRKNQTSISDSFSSISSADKV